MRFSEPLSLPCGVVDVVLTDKEKLAHAGSSARIATAMEATAIGLVVHGMDKAPFFVVPWTRVSHWIPVE